MRIALLILMACGGLWAADAPKIPAIPAELRARFWRSQAENTVAQAQLEKTKAVLQSAITEMQKACGEKHELTVGQDGEPACVAKPEKPAEPGTK